ncbi:MAG: hypothetical protein GY874_14380 [Desulfobacteraceae bacterium]|nr:hypothetical protein [Desulfobacteraceae bacterium]
MPTQHEIDITGALDKIIIGATGLEQIVQNVKTILATVRGSVPLDRNFGVACTYVDDAVPAVKAKLAADIVQSINTYEPRVEVTNIDFSEADANGKMEPVVRIKIKDSVSL